MPSRRNPRRPAPRRAESPQPLPAPREPAVYSLPAREWFRATDFLSMFIASGWVLNGRPQSILLIGEPSSGKTELLMRFRDNPTLHYASDLTVMGLHRTLKQAKSGAVTHVVATEFQKWFMRKRDAVTNLLGTLSQAMDEGVGTVDVGEHAREFGGARIGFIGATTPQSYREQERFLSGLGFLSRTTAIDWEMPREEVYEVMTAINAGDERDLAPVVLAGPPKRMRVDLPPALSEYFQKWVWQYYRDDSVMRIFKRLRVLSMSCALLDGRDVVHARDIEKVVAFAPYWEHMKRGSL